MITDIKRFLMELDMSAAGFENPFRPGAGHMPPHLAGRTQEQELFRKLLKQTTITENLIISGLRGVGKTVLLETLKPIARSAGWLWVGDDFTESKGLNEERIADRIVTDLSLAMSPLFIQTQLEMPMGFTAKTSTTTRPLDYSDLRAVYDRTPGLPADKLKSVLRSVGTILSNTSFKGIIFAYDEAQNLGDRAQDKQYPLSLVLDVFQSIQRSPGGLPFMLVLTGLPTIFPKLTDTRTYSERMFEIIYLEKLSDDDCAEAITKPIQDSKCPLSFTDTAVRNITKMSGGYPYFIQFICKEVFDSWINQIDSGHEAIVPQDEIMRKLDQRFFSGRWDNASDRQREFMKVVAMLPSSDGEFRIQDVVQQSREVLQKPFAQSSAGMMLKTLIENSFVYRNRRGKYSFAVPLLDQFILRQMHNEAKFPFPFGDGYAA